MEALTEAQNESWLFSPHLWPTVRWLSPTGPSFKRMKYCLSAHAVFRVRMTFTSHTSCVGFSSTSITCINCHVSSQHIYYHAAKSSRMHILETTWWLQVICKLYNCYRKSLLACMSLEIKTFKIRQERSRASFYSQVQLVGTFRRA